MFKLISVALVFVAGVMTSMEYTKKHQQELNFTKGLISVFEYMSNEIFFEHNFLGEALKNGASYGGLAKEYIEAIAERIINKASAKEAFLSVKTNLTGQVYDILYEYFSQAGMFDAKTEKERICSLAAKLKSAEKEQTEYIKNTVSQNKKIILAFTVFICIFMM